MPPPSSIKSSDFSGYPPLAQRVATEHLPLLRRLPTVLAAILLREIIIYDWKFPAERADMDRHLQFLGSMADDQFGTAMAGFAALPLSASLENEPWVAAPADFTEKLTAYLWTNHQIDNFREAAEAYQRNLTLSAPEPEPAMPRLCVVIVGKDAEPGTMKLFTRLQPYGTYFTNVRPARGLDSLFAAMSTRVQAHPEPYAHWYVDGGVLYKHPISQPSTEDLISVSYAELGPVRHALLQKVETARTSGVVGPEDLRSMLAQLRPDQIAPSSTSRDALLRHFELTLLTEGSGTQIFSTTFVQWTARELLRRARPLTLVLRFTPRQAERPMNELLRGGATSVQYDPAGSLVDADIGAYYTWINLMRLRGSEQTRFIAWFEDQQEAMVIAPAMPKKTISEQSCDLQQILTWIS